MHIAILERTLQRSYEVFVTFFNRGVKMVAPDFFLKKKLTEVLDQND